MLGVCYYPEHWPEAQWADDARRMRELGLRHVRVGEFAWSRIEPRRGEFDFAWLDRALDVLAAAGLRIVMCTPTATPPKWLVDERPEILAWDEQERPRRFGSRRHYCFASPAWHEETRRICTVLAERYGSHPAIEAWQLDNEYGCHDTVMSYAPHCRPAFRAWLAERYGTIEELNQAWGTAFWSQDYQSFEEVDPPNSTVTEPHPAHRLDYRRFCSDQVAAYNTLQVEIVRAHAPGRSIMHNFMGLFTAFAHEPVAAELDFASWDSYPLGFTDQRMVWLSEADRLRYARTGHPDVAALHHDLYRGVAKNGRFWVMEQQPGPVNWAPHNPAPAPGLVRLWTLEALAHGAEVVSFFRWRQLPFGQEQCHAGLIRPDGALDTGGEEVARVAGELAALDLQSEPCERAPVALLFDESADWALRIQPQGQEFAYWPLVFAFYTALRRLGIDVDLKRPGQALDGYRLVVVPSLPLMTSAAVEAIAQSGAIAVFGPRTGSRTTSHAIPADLPPGPLQARLPIKVVRVESLAPNMSDRVVWRNQSWPCRIWRERIETTLPADGLFDDGDGAIFSQDGWVYLAFWPDETFLDAFFRELLATLDLAPAMLPEGLRVRQRGKLTFAFNRSDQTVAAPAGPDVDFVLGERNIKPFDVAIWR